MEHGNKQNLMMDVMVSILAGKSREAIRDEICEMDLTSDEANEIISTVLASLDHSTKILHTTLAETGFNIHESNESSMSALPHENVEQIDVLISDRSGSMPTQSSRFKNNTTDETDYSNKRNVKGALIFFFFLLIPTSLTLGTGDPTDPSIGGLFLAVVSLLTSLILFKKPTYLAVFISAFIFLVASYTFKINPMQLSPTDSTPIFGILIYYLICRAGAAAIISAVAHALAWRDMFSISNEDKTGKKEETLIDRTPCSIQKYSKFAILGFLLSTVGLVASTFYSYKYLLPVYYPWLFSCLPAGLMGSISLISTASENHRKKGMFYSISSIILFVIISVISLSVWMTTSHYHKNYVQQQLCLTRMVYIYKSLEEYVEKYGDNIDSDLIHYLNSNFQKESVDLTSEYIYRISKHRMDRLKADFAFNRCFYAFNNNLLNKQLSDLPGDVVLFFETHEHNNGLGSLRNAANPHSLKNISDFNYGWEQYVMGNAKKNKYSFGTLSYALESIKSNDVRGCNIIFVNGTAEFVDADRVANLDWGFGLSMN